MRKAMSEKRREINMKRATIFAAFVFIFLSGINGADGQPLPDLIVAKIECAPPQSRLSITIANQSNVPLPKGWMAVADVYFDRTKIGDIDLGGPTSGCIQPAGGTANYLVVLDIVKPVTVKVVADPTNDIKESNETNNTKVEKLTPCEKVGVPDRKKEDQNAQEEVINTPFGKLKRSGRKKEDQNAQEEVINTPFGKLKRSDRKKEDQDAEEEVITTPFGEVKRSDP
jgi:hypothetical protein